MAIIPIGQEPERIKKRMDTKPILSNLNIYLPVLPKPPVPLSVLSNLEVTSKISSLLYG